MKFLLHTNYAFVMMLSDSQWDDKDYKGTQNTTDG